MNTDLNTDPGSYIGRSIENDRAATTNGVNSLVGQHMFMGGKPWLINSTDIQSRQAHKLLASILVD